MSGLLSGHGIEMAFGGVRALKGVDIELRPGSRVGLIGSNGSGKTTLLNVLSGVYRATAGEVRFHDRDITKLVPGARGRAGIVRTFQHPQLAASLTVRENVELGARLARHVHGRSHRADEAARAADALEHFGCGAYADGLPDEVPYGVRKMAEIARVAAVEAPVVLLDEPAAGLSREERDELIAAISALNERRPETAMCLIEHDVRLVAALCDELVVLATGERLAFGPTAQVLRDERVRAAYLGERDHQTEIHEEVG